MSCKHLAVDAKQVADLLGISLSHLHNLRKTGRFAPAAIRMGRSVRFICQEVTDWLSAGSPSRDRWVAARESQKHQR